MDNFTLCMNLIQLYPLLCWTYGAWTSVNVFLFPPTPELVDQLPFRLIYGNVFSLAQRTGRTGVINPRLKFERIDWRRLSAHETNGSHSRDARRM